MAEKSESEPLLPRRFLRSNLPPTPNCVKPVTIAFASGIVVLASVVTTRNIIPHEQNRVYASRSSAFPPGFFWGAATSAYQVEGGSNEGGRGPSIWDDWCARSRENCNGDTGDVTDDHYHRWEEDIDLMKSLGLTAYRFSVSWSRVLPQGSVEGGVNEEGIAFYSAIIDALLERDIQPFITLYHWDLPQALEDSYGGWADPSIINDFGDYARLCYQCFSRVKHWITINEGWTTAIHGYEEGSNAPGFKGEDVGGTGKPYLVGHHLLLAHAKAVEIFREGGYDGSIGISNSGDYRFPMDPTNEGDREAATRSMEFQLGWMTDPIWLGDYPASMRNILGERLPQFTDDERRTLLGSADFLGLNHYSSALASAPAQPATYGGYWADQSVTLGGDPSWNQTEMGWNVVPEGARGILLWIDRRYHRPLVYITENGMAAHEPDKEHSIRDTARVEYLAGYIRGFGQALVRGANLGGYFAWSLFDNFEWQYGFSKRFGIVHVNYTTLERTPKSSAHFYREVIASNGAILPK